jgi:hypothetical protein
VYNIDDTTGPTVILFTVPINPNSLNDYESKCKIFDIRNTELQGQIEPVGFMTLNMADRIENLNKMEVVGREDRMNDLGRAF